MTIYEKYGGEETITSLVEQFYQKVLNDERVNGLFANVNLTRLKRHQTEFFIQVLGGPPAYKGLDMRAAHKHLNLNQDHFAAVAQNLQKTLEEAGVEKSDIDTIMAQVGSLQPEVLNLPG